jgi:hypothetical protein
MVKSQKILSLDSVVSASKDQIFSELVDEAVILDLRTGVYYGIDSVGARIWQLLQQPKAVGEISTLLQAEYQVAAARCEDDLLIFLSNLQAKGLIEIQNESGG